MKYLIVGLGNIGPEYVNTRHNIGFKVVNALAEELGVSFNDLRYGAVAEGKYKARTFIMLKPNTFMNLSGHAVDYWMKKEKIALENTLVIVDDIALPFGTLRMRGKGSDAGHNGLKHIQQILGHNLYSRIRFGIGGDFKTGQQVNYVLGEWKKEEKDLLQERIKICIQMVQSFTTIGLERTMTQYNGK